MTVYIRPQGYLFPLLFLVLTVLLLVALGSSMRLSNDLSSRLITALAVLPPIIMIFLTWYACYTARVVVNEKGVVIQTFLRTHNLLFDEIEHASLSGGGLPEGLKRAFGISIGEYHSGVFRAPGYGYLVLLVNGNQSITLFSKTNVYMLATGNKTPDFTDLLRGNGIIIK